MNSIPGDDVLELQVPDEGTAAGTFLVEVEGDAEPDEVWPFPESWPRVAS